MIKRIKFGIIIEGSIDYLREEEYDDDDELYPDDDEDADEDDEIDYDDDAEGDDDEIDYDDDLSLDMNLQHLYDYALELNPPTAKYNGSS